MSQHALTIPNDTRANVRVNIQSALQALGSTSKGNNAPSTPYSGQLWLDDNTPSSSVWELKIYDGTDWIVLGYVDSSANTFTVKNSLPLPGSGGVGGAYYMTGQILLGQNTTTVPGAGNTTLGAGVTNDGSAHFSNNGAYVLSVNRNSDGTVVALGRSGSAGGSISVASGSASFNTSSDYRLKIERGEIGGEDAFAKILAMRPIWFNWTRDPDGPLVDGFLARPSAAA